MKNSYDPHGREPNWDGADPPYYSSPECPRCGGEMDFEDCEAPGCEDGYYYPYENNPLEYEPNERERCTMCDGYGGTWFCVNSWDFCQVEGVKRGAEDAVRWRWS